MTPARPAAGRGSWQITAAILAAAVSLLCPDHAHAQTATAAELKAAFLFNFARFTEWPGDALGPADPLVLCVINDTDVADRLGVLAKGRAIEGHRVVVRTVRPEPAALLTCRLVFQSGHDPIRSLDLLDTLAGKPMLTVGDGDRFAESGGVVGLYVEGGTLKFAVNPDAAQRAGLRLSSKLLKFANIVKDGPNVKRR